MANAPRGYHRHRPRGESTPRAWQFCVSPYACSGAAHGNVTYVDRCTCGAERWREVNGSHVTRSRWQGGLDADE